MIHASPADSLEKYDRTRTRRSLSRQYLLAAFTKSAKQFLGRRARPTSWSHLEAEHLLSYRRCLSNGVNVFFFQGVVLFALSICFVWRRLREHLPMAAKFMYLTSSLKACSYTACIPMSAQNYRNLPTSQCESHESKSAPASILTLFTISLEDLHFAKKSKPPETAAD
jgi:hypothetical protein